MYNDYYLQQIYNRLGDLEENQLLINQTLVSGDIAFKNYHKEFRSFSYTISTVCIFIILFICLTLFYDFYHHLFERK